MRFRHPREVTFTASLSEDLRRRDFTINAMAYNDREGLVDLYGGMEDLQKKVIRCVGDPEERFGEDALRILRAVRFSAQLDCGIQEDTRRAVVKLAPTLKKDQRGTHLRGTAETALFSASGLSAQGLGDRHHPGRAAGIRHADGDSAEQSPSLF